MATNPTNLGGHKPFRGDYSKLQGSAIPLPGMAELAQANAATAATTAAVTNNKGGRGGYFQSQGLQRSLSVGGVSFTTRLEPSGFESIHRQPDGAGGGGTATVNGNIYFTETATTQTIIATQTTTQTATTTATRVATPPPPTTATRVATTTPLANEHQSLTRRGSGIQEDVIVIPISDQSGVTQAVTLAGYGSTGENNNASSLSTPLINGGVRHDKGITRREVLAFLFGAGLMGVGTLLAIYLTSDDNESSCPALVDDGSIFANYTHVLANLWEATLDIGTHILFDSGYPGVPFRVNPRVANDFNRIKVSSTKVLDKFLP